MTRNKKYTLIISFELSMSEGLFLQMSDNTERHFDIDEFTEFLQETQDLEDFTNDEGEVYDDGEGFYSPAMTIDWPAAIDHFKNIETITKFYKSNHNLILS